MQRRAKTQPLRSKMIRRHLLRNQLRRARRLVRVRLLQRRLKPSKKPKLVNKLSLSDCRKKKKNVRQRKKRHDSPKSRG